MVCLWLWVEDGNEKLNCNLWMKIIYKSIDIVRFEGKFC